MTYKSMTHKSKAALLAAVEIGNKVTVSYREETFVLLLLNAWEIMLKARIVQEHGDELACITKRADVDVDSNLSRRTISITKALGRLRVPSNVKTNLLGIIEVRNCVAHLGDLDGECRETIRKFGGASVVNFGKLYHKWFGETLPVPYLLPIAFVGEADILPPRRMSGGQRRLLNHLSSLIETSRAEEDGYEVALSVTVSIRPATSGGGATVGATNDPHAPRLHLSDDELINKFPWVYKDVVNECKMMSEFKRNPEFHGVLKEVRRDPECGFERKLNPTGSRSAKQWRYSSVALERIRAHYTGGEGSDGG